MSIWLDLIHDVANALSGVVTRQLASIVDDAASPSSVLLEPRDTLWTDYLAQWTPRPQRDASPMVPGPMLFGGSQGWARPFGNAGDLFTLRIPSAGPMWRVRAPGRPHIPAPVEPEAQGVDRWNALFAEASAATGVPVPVLKAIASIESGGRPTAVSPAGAMGIMQIMPFHFDLNVEDPFDPRTNIMRGAEILARNYLLTGSWEGAAARYFGLGTDVTGMDTNRYVQRFREALARLSE